MEFMDYETYLENGGMNATPEERARMNLIITRREIALQERKDIALGIEGRCDGYKPNEPDRRYS
jgi:hypothetical protein